MLVTLPRNHNLDERIFLYNEVIKIRQVRFHPGSPDNNHLLALTSDNTLRLYCLENSKAYFLSKYQIGETPFGVFPGTKTSYLAALGEVGVDFDFSEPDNTTNDVVWPVYVLRGDGSVYHLNIPLDENTIPKVTGPLVTNTDEGFAQEEACAIISLHSTPDVICIANSKGTIHHYIVVPSEDQTNRELLCFESIELELGLSTTTEDTSYSCPIFLHQDESRNGRYFATHSTGLHLVNITTLRDLQNWAITNDNYTLEDIFLQGSKVEYLVCTKTGNSNISNPVIGFAPYYDPTSIILLLGDGHLITLAILSEILSKIDTSDLGDKTLTQSPLKQILREPFDQVIEKILKRSSSQPILKLNGDQKPTQKECYELLQRAGEAFRNYIENHTRAKEEIEKRVKALKMMKEFQLNQLARMNQEKQILREKTETLAEKYEDMKDHQDLILQRCEELLVLASEKKPEASDAEKDYHKLLVGYQEKIDRYKTSIDKLTMKVRYQEVQISNWKAQEVKKASNINEKHSETIKRSLTETSDKIQDMIKDIKEIKERLKLQ